MHTFIAELVLDALVSSTHARGEARCADYGRGVTPCPTHRAARHTHGPERAKGVSCRRRVPARHGDGERDQEGGGAAQAAA